MATRKRNEWLEADLDDEEQISDGDELEESRGQSIAHRSTKRRRIHSESGSEAEASEAEEESAEQTKVVHDGDDVEEDIDDAAEAPKSTAKDIKEKAKIEKKLRKGRDATSRSGVIYISRVPPFMKPHTLKNLLTPYAPSGIGRIFLTPEDMQKRATRVKNGGNKKKTFVDGWVEFTSKKEAKVAVESLNTRTIGGKKGGYYVDDVWNLKYLKGFKWRHLTEQIANENAERAARMRAEGASARREMNEFLQNAHRAKIDDTRLRQRKERAERTGVEEEAEERPKIAFKQNKSVKTKSSKAKTEKPGEDVQRVLSKIF